MPLNPEPVALDEVASDRGLFVLRQPREFGGSMVAYAVTWGFFDGHDEPAYISHFATCPNAARHRRSPRTSRKEKSLPPNVAREAQRVLDRVARRRLRSELGELDPALKRFASSGLPRSNENLGDDESDQRS